MSGRSPGSDPATAGDPAAPEPLRGVTRADACVIGAGFTGLAAALNLAEQGLDVVLLEAEAVGYGASGLGGGLVGSGQVNDVFETEALFGYRKSRLLWDLAELAKQEVRDRIARHSVDCDLQKGQLIGLRSPRQRGYAPRLADTLAEHYAYPDTHALDREAIRAMVATDAFVAGLFDPNALVLQPLDLLRGLARAATGTGVRLHERSRVTAYTQTDPATVSTAQGSVQASFVVLACNGYLDGLEPRLAETAMPVNRFMIATEPLGETRASSLVSGRFGVRDTRLASTYFRLTADHRLLFGGGETGRAALPRHIDRIVRPKLLEVFPGLGDVRTEQAWGARETVTANRLPQVGRLAPNVYFAQGYCGHGISIASFAGKLMADAIVGTTAGFDVFAALPVQAFAGGRWLRYPGRVLAMLYNGLCNRF